MSSEVLFLMPACLTPGLHDRLGLAVVRSVSAENSMRDPPPGLQEVLSAALQDLAHTLQILRGIDPRPWRPRSGVNRDAVAVPECAQLFQGL